MYTDGTIFVMHMKTMRRIIFIGIIASVCVTVFFIRETRLSKNIPTPECTSILESDVTAEGSSSESEATGSSGIDPRKYNSLCIPVKKAEDQKKKGDVHSRIGDMGFSMNGKSTGISPDVGRFIFEKRVEIVGIWVSIAYPDPQITQFDFEARINASDSGYGTLGSTDILLHTTFSCVLWDDCNRQTNEHIWFGKQSGIEVASNEWISFGAWMTNENSLKVAVYPKFIVWYRWLE